MPPLMMKESYLSGMRRNQPMKVNTKKKYTTTFSVWGQSEPLTQAQKNRMYALAKGRRYSWDETPLTLNEGYSTVGNVLQYPELKENEP